MLGEKYKQILLSYKETLRQKIIETELESKTHSDFSIPAVFFPSCYHPHVANKETPEGEGTATSGGEPHVPLPRTKADEEG